MRLIKIKFDIQLRLFRFGRRALKNGPAKMVDTSTSTTVLCSVCVLFLNYFQTTWKVKAKFWRSAARITEARRSKRLSD